MASRDKFAAMGSVLLALVVLSVCSWLYWPGTAGPDLLDDRSSVMVGGDLGANPDEVFDLVFGDKSGVFGRSVSMATFAVERLYFDAGMAGSKKVNILLHCVNAVLFMVLAALLMRFRSVRGYPWLAVLLGAMWLLHPLLVSSVLYVVQRMAMMAALFMLLSAIAYVRWRLAIIAGRSGLWWLLLLPLLLVLGLLAKENAVVIVPILLMLEMLWFRFEGYQGRQLPWMKILVWGLVGTGALALGAYYVLFHESLAAAFRNRHFTLHERELTQLRIVWDYVAQWFWPEVGRMGLYHDDFPLSRSLVEPATTLWALLAWLGVLVTCVLIARGPGGGMIAFGVAWFLLGHSVESTVLPLELYFEHRNYFPAMGLVIALGGLYASVVGRWPETGPPLLVLAGFLCVVLAGLASSQAQVWSSRQLLTLYQLNGHPNSFRANADMASEFAMLGEIEEAYRFSERAHEGSKLPAAKGESYGDYQLRDIALACIAGAEVPAQQIAELGTVRPQRPFSTLNMVVTLVRMIQDGDCESIDAVRLADRMAEIFLVEDFRGLARADIFSTLAVLENVLQRYDMAYAYTERYLAFNERNVQGLLMQLHFATALGKFDEADELIAKLQRQEARGKLTVSQQKTLSLYGKSRN